MNTTLNNSDSTLILFNRVCIKSKSIGSYGGIDGTGFEHSSDVSRSSRDMFAERLKLASYFNVVEKRSIRDW